MGNGDSRRGSDRFLSDGNSHPVTLVTHAEDQAPNAIRRPDSNKPTVLLNTSQCENALKKKLRSTTRSLSVSLELLLQVDARHHGVITLVRFCRYR
jgi:hypothetical protein